MVLTDEALLINDFPGGSEVTLECGNGYERESGLGIISCIDNKWTEPDLVCKKKDCGQPKAEPHVYFNTSQGTLFGSAAEAKCEEGYKISGPSFIHCYSSGWFGKPRCNIVTCNIPNKVENGESSWNGKGKPQYGQRIHFSCNTGYIMSGSESIICTKTGKYDSTPPQCIERSSSTPTSHRTTSVTARASTVKSTLEQGYRKIPSEENTTTTSVLSSTSSSLKGQNIETLNVNKDKGYAAVVVSVIVVTLVVCIVAFFLNKFFNRRKGSYDTGEDQKPELLQFQDL